MDIGTAIIISVCILVFGPLLTAAIAWSVIAAVIWLVRAGQ